MGSGHFLLAACQRLAEQLATNPYSPSEPAGGGDEAAITYWKRRVVENCLYGVDVNPLAVDLAKLALWLETVAADRPLTFLDHHLQHGNSLIGARLRGLGALHGDTGLTGTAFRSAFGRKVSALLKPLADIRDTPSDSIKAVKHKARRFGDYTEAVKPFRQLADLWTAEATGMPLDGVSYNEAAECVDRPGKFNPLTTRDWFMAADKLARLKLQAFHWDLAFPEVFCDETGERAGGGFDAVIGNPPYEVLSRKESGIDPTDLKAFAESEPLYHPAIRGKQNLYKLFICRALDVLRDGGRFGFIVPMPLLGDDQAADVRRHMAKLGEFTAIEAFPQKDNPQKRVFADAKLSTAVFTFLKEPPRDGGRKFLSRVHPERTVETDSPSLALTTGEIPLYDPNNFTIASCGQDDWDLAVRIMKTGRLVRLGSYCTSFQGEVNETNEKGRCLSYSPNGGPLVLRGSNVCQYQIRGASQGDDIYLDVAAFLMGKKEKSKAHDSKQRRVGFQRKAPQNNFRRLIAAEVPSGTYCLESISYIPESSSSLPLRFVLGLLTSLLLDWYFRLGSSNAQVNEYQFDVLPCPHFHNAATSEEMTIGKQAADFLATDRLDKAAGLVEPLTRTAPFSPVLRDVVVAAVDRIIAFEANRGDITRAERSRLAPEAQPLQDFLDDLFFRMAGLTPAEVAGLRQRYEEMKKVK